MFIEPKKWNQYPWYLRWLYKKQKQKFGDVLMPGLMWGRHPFLFLLFLSVGQFFNRRKSHLEPALRSLVQVRISQLNNCEFCVDLNSLYFSQKAGVMDKLMALPEWASSEHFSDREKAALRFAEVVTRAQWPIDPGLKQILLSHFEPDALTELAALISFQNMSAKFNAGLEIPSQGLCHRADTKR